MSNFSKGVNTKGCGYSDHFQCNALLLVSLQTSIGQLKDSDFEK